MFNSKPSASRGTFFQSRFNQQQKYHYFPKVYHKRATLPLPLLQIVMTSIQDATIMLLKDIVNSGPGWRRNVKRAVDSVEVIGEEKTRSLDQSRVGRHFQKKSGKQTDSHFFFKKTFKMAFYFSKYRIHAYKNRIQFSLYSELRRQACPRWVPWGRGRSGFTQVMLSLEKHKAHM